MRNALLILHLAIGLAFVACHPAKKSSTGTNKPDTSGRPTGKPAPMDTLRWTNNPSGKPPIGGVPANPTASGDGETYHIAFLLPFLSNQMTGETVPEKSRLAVQFYAGAKIALEQLSSEAHINLVTDVFDTQINDADFQKLLNNPRLEKSSVFIGPVRSSHVQAFGAWTKARKKILVSPESPNADLTDNNPDFLQLNPSLRAHCEAITQFIRKYHRPDAVTLVCKQKEADRLAYFQQANAAMGGNAQFAELVLPDDSPNFDKTDLKKFLRYGKTSVFVLPSWASQDFVMAFLRKLKESKGANKVEVYGMPQWRNFEIIDPEYLSSLNVHVSAASWVDYTTPESKDFQQKFYDSTGTIPDEDGFSGYDATMYVGQMLGRYGLSFPEHLEEANASNLHGRYVFEKVFSNGALDDGRNRPDYWENAFVHILKFEKYGFVPAE